MSEEIEVEVDVISNEMIVDDSDTDIDTDEEINNTDDIVTENVNSSVRSAAWMYFKLDKKQ